MSFVKDKSSQLDMSGLELLVDVVNVGGNSFELGAVTAAAVVDIDSSHKLQVEINGTTYYIPLNTDADFQNA